MKRIELFGSVFCPYCHQAKDLLEQRKIEYEYREVPMMFGWKPPFPVYLEMKRRSGGKRTVPQIFVDGEYYGDEERLFADDRHGRLSEWAGELADAAEPAGAEPASDSTRAKS